MEPVDWLPEPVSQILFWVYYNQALIAGLMALFVGWMTVVSIRKQINEDKAAREDRRKRELLSLKAGATISVAEIYEYSGQCISFLSAFLLPNGELNGDIAFDVAFDEKIKAEGFNLPPYPASAFRVLQQLILHSDAQDGVALHEILSFSQAHRSSIVQVSNSLLGKSSDGLIATTNSVYAEVRDCLGLRQHMVRLFGWARTTEDQILPLCSAVEAADALMWSNLSHHNITDYVKTAWPPRSPAKSKISELWPADESAQTDPQA